MDPGLQRAPPVADEIEDEHPAAANAEFPFAAQVLIHGEEHPCAEKHEGQSDDLLEYRVHPRWEDRAKQERGDAEDEHDEGVTERVERREPDGVPLLVREARLRERVHRAGSLGGVLVLVAPKFDGIVPV